MTELETLKKTFKLSRYIENDENGRNWLKVKKYTKQIIWTDHSTNNEHLVTNGARKFEDETAGRWQTYGWYVAKESWDKEWARELAYSVVVEDND